MKKILVMLAISGMGVSAFAGSNQDQASGRTISFEDLKVACLHPEQFHNQKAPTSIQLSCRDVQVRWVPDQSSSVTAGTSRHITTSVQSDKYAVGSLTEALPTDGQGLACPRFKEIAETMETIRAVSCDDLVSFKGGATEYCLSVLDSVKKSNASAQLVDTGNVMDFCASDLSKGHQGQEGQAPVEERRSDRRGRVWPF